MRRPYPRRSKGTRSRGEQSGARAPHSRTLPRVDRGLAVDSPCTYVKILVLTHLYPPHHAGTYDLRCQTQTDTLRLRGHAMHVLTSRHGMKNEQRSGDVDRRLILNGVYDHKPITRFRELRAVEMQNHAILRESIASFKPDLIHVYSLHGLPKSFVFALRNSRAAGFEAHLLKPLKITELGLTLSKPAYFGAVPCVASKIA